MVRPTTDRAPASVRHDIFDVTQLTSGSELETLVAADHVRVEPGQESQIHRHNEAETVLFVLDGSGTVVVDDIDHDVAVGDRIHIGRGVFHGVRTGADQALVFLSVQSPPILDAAAGRLDLEPRQQRHDAA